MARHNHALFNRFEPDNACPMDGRRANQVYSLLAALMALALAACTTTNEQISFRTNSSDPALRLPDSSIYVDGAYEVCSGFGATKKPSGEIRPKTKIWNYGVHTGIDICTPAGEPLYAVIPGEVVRILRNPPALGAYGKEVIVRSDGILSATIIYGHVKNVEVEVGQKVDVGEVIAYTELDFYGPSHLHLDVEINGRRVDPIDFFVGYRTRTIECAVHRNPNEDPYQRAIEGRPTLAWPACRN